MLALLCAESVTPASNTTTCSARIVSCLICCSIVVAAHCSRRPAETIAGMAAPAIKRA
jgi:hypothetical protein